MIESSLDLIRNSTIENLKDLNYLEHNLIPNLGLNAGSTLAYPQYLHKYTNSGLNVWQYPNQFAKYLLFLNKQDINSYLEIGTNHGGSFITTIEYLNKIHNKNINAFGIDIFGVHPNLREYEKLNQNVKILQLDSTGQRFKDEIENQIKNKIDQKFDLCLIDGYHSYDVCMKDFELVKSKSKIISIHDISDEYIGVINAWKEISKDYKDHTIIEIVDQYDYIPRYYMGFGIIKFKMNEVK